MSMNPYQPFERVPVFEGIKFTDLFESWSEHDTNPKLKTPEIQLNNFNNEFKATFLQCWLSFSGGKKWVASLNVKPTNKAIRAVCDNMLMIDYDRIYFEAIVFEDHFDLYIRYNLIIGSRLVASFPLSELPKI